MQEPIGSMDSSLVKTATFDLEPGSRAMIFISTVLLFISGISNLNNSLRIFGWRRETIISGPFEVLLT